MTAKEMPRPAETGAPNGTITNHDDRVQSTNGDRQEQLDTYLDNTFGNREGFVHVSLFSNPYRTVAGKYEHRDRDHKAVRWPEQRQELAAAILHFADIGDVYTCPYLSQSHQRTKGHSGALNQVHADVDNHIDLDEVQRLGGWALCSGTPGHAHVGISLAHAITPAQHEVLQRALIKRLGGDPGKISDNDLLRPPGTFNHKATVPVSGDPKEPNPVEWLLRPTGEHVDPFALAAQLNADITNITAARAESERETTPAALPEPIDLDGLPDPVRAALDRETGDRSADTMRIVAACYDAKLTEGQTRTVVKSRKDLADRLNARNDDDFKTCWNKIHDDRKTQEWANPVNNNPTTIDSDAPASHKDNEKHSGQLRIAYRLAGSYKDKLIHVHGIGWHYWDGTRFTHDDVGKARRAVIATLKKALADSINDKELRADVKRCESDAGIKGVLAIAASLTEFASTVSELDVDPYLLNVANGTLDLRTMTLEPHHPRNRITKITRAAYDPHALNATWATFLARVLPEKPVRDYLQRVIGISLLGKVIEHVLAILTGTGGNGKGTFYGACLWAFGDYGSTVEPDLFMHREGAHPTGEMDLLGCRLVVVSESERDRRLAEATVKRLTGGDKIRARRMRQDFIEFPPSHTPLLITNHLPKVSGDDPAMWRRLRVVPFTVEIPKDERDGNLEEQLQAEADAILTWAVTGWNDYRANGLDEPPAVLVATDDYQKASDAVRRFIGDRCDPAHKITTKELFCAWEMWRDDDGADGMSKTAFGKALKRLGYTSTESNGQTWWLGITILKS